MEQAEEWTNELARMVGATVRQHPDRVIILDNYDAYSIGRCIRREQLVRNIREKYNSELRQFLPEFLKKNGI